MDFQSAISELNLLVEQLRTQGQSPTGIDTPDFDAASFAEITSKSMHVSDDSSLLRFQNDELVKENARLSQALRDLQVLYASL